MLDHLNIPTTVAGARAATFLRGVAAWAAGRPDVVAVALVGSWARGMARPDSDLNLVVVVRDPAGYLVWTDWLKELGKPGDVVREDWGAVRSLRVWYADGPEVELGLAGPAWLSVDPVDPGTAEVIGAGARIVHDPEGRLARLVARVAAASEAANG